MQPKWITILRVAVMFTIFGLNLASCYLNGKGDRVNSDGNPDNGSTWSWTSVRDQRTNQE